MERKNRKCNGDIRQNSIKRKEKRKEKEQKKNSADVIIKVIMVDIFF